MISALFICCRPISRQQQQQWRRSNGHPVPSHQGFQPLTLILVHLFPSALGQLTLLSTKDKLRNYRLGERRGWGVGGHNNKSCLVLIKGPQRSPAVTNRAREGIRRRQRTHGEGSLRWVWWVFIFKRVLQSLHTFFSPPPPPPFPTRVHIMVCQHKSLNISLRLSFKVKTSKEHLENKSVLLILGA